MRRAAAAPYELEIDPRDPNVFLRACAAIDKALRAAKRKVRRKAKTGKDNPRP